MSTTENGTKALKKIPTDNLPDGVAGIEKPGTQEAALEASLRDAQSNPEPATPSLPLPDAGVFRRPRGTASATHTDHRIQRPNRDRLNLYIMRHASAGTRRTNPKLDVKRPLDKEGKRHCFHLAHALNGMRVNFDLIVSSSLKRCLQTAQLIGTEVGYESKILHAEALMPGADYGQFQRLVQECRTFENVLLVGHNPTLSMFLGQLISHTSDEMDGPNAIARVRLRKGSLARVTVDREPAMLQVLLHPRVVRALYETSTKSSRRKTSRK